MTYPTKPHDWSKNPPKVGDRVRVWGYAQSQTTPFLGMTATVIAVYDGIGADGIVAVRQLETTWHVHLLNCFPVEEEPVELPDERKGERRYGQGMLWFLSTDSTQRLRPNVDAPGYFMRDINILYRNRRMIYSDRRVQNLGRKARKS